MQHKITVEALTSESDMTGPKIYIQVVDNLDLPRLIVALNPPLSSTPPNYSGLTELIVTGPIDARQDGTPFPPPQPPPNRVGNP